MQLKSYDSLTPDNIIFNEAKEYKVKDSKIKYQRIPIEAKYPNGTKGSLIIETPLLFSFGVNEKKKQETGKLVGHSIPVCLSTPTADRRPTVRPHHRKTNVYSHILTSLGAQEKTNFTSML